MSDRSYTGKVYLAPSGQWGFKFYKDEIEIGGGAGFESEKEAKVGCAEVLWSYDKDAQIKVVQYEQLPA